MRKNGRRKLAKINNRKKAVIICVEAILILIIIFCFTKIVVWATCSMVESDKNSKLNEEVVKIYREDRSDNVDIYEEKEEEEEAKTTYIDFDKLEEINNDIVGWIIIDGTNINYPILQTSNNDFYLHNNYMKEYSQSGSIFLDYRCDLFNDKATVIYGHNMTDGKMFHELTKIYNHELGDSVKIEIYTKEKDYIFNVISTFMIMPDEFSLECNFKDLVNRSIYNFEFGNVDENRIVALYTCNITADKRIIVYGALCNK
ncbi:MAG: class B sortase [Clostridia bacterium]|nr:class B sortase [Clostridia bacterium]